MKAGLNLYSIRNQISTENDFLNTAVKLKEMGYEYIQFSGAPFNPSLIKKVKEESGLEVVLTHVPYDRIVFDTEKLFTEHASFGCKNIGLGIIPIDSTKNEEDWTKKIDEFNLAGEKIAKLGGKLFYHHHFLEFYKLKNGKTIFDYMVENAPFVNFTLDSYWVQNAGYNPITFAERLNGRIECVHLKDYGIKKDESAPVGYIPNFAPVGHGSLDMKSIIGAWKNCAAKYFLVEQDDATDYANPFAEIKKSIDYLKTI
ncbi:MAG: sugar phosphate isomerase/epimerase [Clostridia bacterium]|nr:sugar phosphate isomerase/epimerase [Clostridia bacterium]